MTKNQQRIIDSLIAEFNSVDQKPSNKLGSLIDLDALDAVNQRHRDLTADAERTKKLWEQQRIEYIDNLVEQIRDEIGHRLCVNRGNIATDSNGWFDSIFIYKLGTHKALMCEEALRFTVRLTYKVLNDETTGKRYDIYNGFVLSRYVTPNSETRYNNEVEFFNCKWTKEALKNLLS
jgi:hypothetical protein